MYSGTCLLFFGMLLGTPPINSNHEIAAYSVPRVSFGSPVFCLLHSVKQVTQINVLKRLYAKSQQALNCHLKANRRSRRSCSVPRWYGERESSSQSSGVEFNWMPGCLTLFPQISLLHSSHLSSHIILFFSLSFVLSLLLALSLFIISSLALIAPGSCSW